MLWCTVQATSMLRGADGDSGGVRRLVRDWIDGAVGVPYDLRGQHEASELSRGACGQRRALRDTRAASQLTQYVVSLGFATIACGMQ